jgi:DNA-binding MarR family transcriptional regulator
MANRKQKVAEVLESFGSLRRVMTFRPVSTAKMPRITPSQWGALMLIEQQGKSTVRDVAKALGITSSAATQLIDGLVSSGYVTRKTRAEDRRVVTLALSSTTEKHVGAMKKEVLRKFLKFFDVLNDKEFGRYILLNKKIVKRLLNKNI